MPILSTPWAVFEFDGNNDDATGNHDALFAGSYTAGILGQAVVGTPFGFLMSDPYTLPDFINGDFTVSVWYNLTEADLTTLGTVHITSFADAFVAGVDIRRLELLIRCDGAGNIKVVGSGYEFLERDVPGLTAGWMHVVWKRTAGQARVFVNGVEYGTAATLTTMSGTWGDDFVSTGPGFGTGGPTDQLAIFDSAIPDSEILLLYGNGEGRAYSTWADPDPVAPYIPGSVSESRSKSCADDKFDGLGRQSIAVDQPPSAGDNYPFVGASDIDKLIADAYLSYKDETCNFQRPFRIRWLYGFGCLKEFVPGEIVHDFDALIEDANGKVVFDSREATSFKASLWGTRLRVLQWIDADNDTVLRLVQHISWNEDETPQNWPVYIEPVNGQLDERVSERLLPRVRSLRVDLGSQRQGPLVLANGFNTLIEQSQLAIEDGERLVTTLTISAAPGLGKGKYGPACDPETTDTAGVLRRINNIQGDSSGNFTLDATGCYRIERPVLSVLAEGPPRRVRVRDNSLKLSNDCGPCCECEDFINTYEGIRRLRDRYADLFARAKAVRDLYIKNRNRVIDSANCRKNDPLRVVIRPLCPDEVAVAVGFCNNTDQCLYNLIIPISFEYTSANVSFSECNADTQYNGTGEPDITCNSTFRSGNRDENKSQGNSGNALDFYKLGGEYPHFYAAWERVDPGGLAQVTFRVNFPNSQEGDVAEVSVDAYAIGQSNVPLTGTGSKIPIPGYEPGSGPLTAEAKAARLVDSCKVVRAGLLQEDCCGTDSFSEV